MLVRDATPIQFTLEFSVELATIIIPNSFDRQCLWDDVVGNKGQERDRCNTLLDKLHFEAGTVVHKDDSVAVPAETRVLHRPAHVDKKSLSFLACLFIRHFWQDITLRLRLQACLTRLRLQPSLDYQILPTHSVWPASLPCRTRASHSRRSDAQGSYTGHIACAQGALLLRRCSTYRCCPFSYHCRQLIIFHSSCVCNPQRDDISFQIRNSYPRISDGVSDSFPCRDPP